MSARAATIVTVVGALLAAGAFGAGALAAIRHDEARGAWAAQAGVGAGYDAARSDALYAGVLEHRAQAERAAWLAALGLVVACAALGAPPRTLAPGRRAPLRAWAALAIDAGWLAAVLVGLDALSGALAPDHAGWAALLDRAGSALALAGAWAGLAAGGTPALLALRLRAHAGERSPGLARAAAAIVLAPLALIALPFALAIGARAGVHRTPLHLRWAGLEASTASGRCPRF